MSSRFARCAAAVVVAAVATATAPVLLAGEPVTPAQNKLLAMRAAQADALRKLAEQVYGLRIDASTTVQDFVTQSDEIRTQVKAFLRGAKQVGEPRYYADGACDVDYEMTLQTVITELKRICDGVVRNNKFRGNVFEQITQHTKLTVIRVTGSGAPRAAAEEGAIGDIVEGLAVGVARDKVTRAVPLGWENVTPQGRLMAMRGALVDGYRQIGERVLGVLVKSNTEVKDFVTENDFIQTAMSGTLQGVKVTGERFMSDMIAECDVQMTLETITTIVKRITDGKVKDGVFKGNVFEQAMQQANLTVITATGKSTPAARFIRGSTAVAPPPADVPDWTGQVLKATGACAVDQAMLKENEAQAWLNAERGATIDATRKAAEQLNGLRIDSRTLVKDFVTEHDSIKADMDTYVKGVRVVAKRRNEDGTAEVDVELPLERLWLLISRAKGGR
jgi:hypothetical protein